MSTSVTTKQEHLTAASALAQPNWSRWLFSPRTRPLRFVIVGVLSSGAQLVTLDLLLDLHWIPLAGNIVAFLIGSQCSFLFNTLLTWHDTGTRNRKRIARRWARYMVTISSTLVINQVIFLAAINWLPELVAAALASTLVSGINYVLSSRFVFRT